MKSSWWYYKSCYNHYKQRTKATGGHNYRGRQQLFKYYAFKYGPAFYERTGRLRRIKHILDKIEIKTYKDINGEGMPPNKNRFKL
jgi:hypothetical protein